MLVVFFNDQLKNIEIIWYFNNRKGRVASVLRN